MNCIIDDIQTSQTLIEVEGTDRRFYNSMTLSSCLDLYEFHGPEMQEHFKALMQDVYGATNPGEYPDLVDTGAAFEYLGYCIEVID